MNSSRIPVLVVEDEAPMLEVLHDCLRDWGFEPRLARNHVEAMAPVSYTHLTLPTNREV